jgi:hypothetical protein
MKSEKEIREKLAELEDECGEHDHTIGNRISALEWVVGRRFDL